MLYIVLIMIYKLFNLIFDLNHYNHRICLHETEME